MNAPINFRSMLAFAGIVLGSVVSPIFADTAPTNTGTSIPLPVKFTLKGYVQGRYSDVFGEDSTPGTFEAKRASLTLLADVDKHISALITTTLVPSTVVREAYGEYRFTPSFKGRLGLTINPFGYEVQVSSSRLITLERSQVVSELLANDYTHDRGVFVYYTPTNQPINVYAAVVNGNVIDAKVPNDPNNNKNLVGRVGFAIPGGQVGASAYYGKNQNSQTMNRYGIDLEVTRGALTVQSEVLAGKGSNTFNADTGVTTYSGSNDAVGGYLTLAYQKPGTQGQPYIRYDAYDPQTGTSGNTFKRATIGFNYYLTGNTKVTAEYQTIDDEQRPNIDGAAGVQYQVAF